MKRYIKADNDLDFTFDVSLKGKVPIYLWLNTGEPPIEFSFTKEIINYITVNPSRTITNEVDKNIRERFSDFIEEFSDDTIDYINQYKSEITNAIIKQNRYIDGIDPNEDDLGYIDLEGIYGYINIDVEATGKPYFDKHINKTLYDFDINYVDISDFSF